MEPLGRGWSIRGGGQSGDDNINISPVPANLCAMTAGSNGRRIEKGFSLSTKHDENHVIPLGRIDRASIKVVEV